jgi:hypothetical protein
MNDGWNRIEIQPYGCALHLPPGWEAIPPVPSNGPEILRATGGPGRQVIVFKMRASGGSTAEIADKVVDRLGGLGYEDFATEEVTFAGQQGTRLEFVYRGDDRPERRSWEYFAVRPPVVFCLGLGTGDWDADRTVLEQIATRFELT